MAESYLDSILAKQPRGSYHLLGWSQGGIIAHEIACRLEQRGESQITLILLDSYSRPPAAWTKADLHAPTLWLELYEQFIGRPSASMASQSGEDVKRTVLACLSEEGHIQDYFNDRDLEHMLLFMKHGEGLVLDHEMQIFGGDATLVRAEEVGKLPNHGEDMGWRNWIAGRLTVLRSPGSHTHMVDPPNVTVLAEIVRKILTDTRDRIGGKKPIRESAF